MDEILEQCAFLRKHIIALREEIEDIGANPTLDGLLESLAACVQEIEAVVNGGDITDTDE